MAKAYAQIVDGIVKQFCVGDKPAFSNAILIDMDVVLNPDDYTWSGKQFVHTPNGNKVKPMDQMGMLVEENRKLKEQVDNLNIAIASILGG